MSPELLVTLTTAVVAFGTAVVGLLVKLRDLGAAVQEVHVMVNARMDEALDRISQLDTALRDAGIVPPRPPSPAERRAL